jgi:LysR family transcriptional regulator, transcriptional activator for bauABCD operon
MSKNRTADSRFLLSLDWNLLKVFGQIVANGGVSRAAISIARGQPSVSLALRRLEERLGFTLCRRGASGFELTDRGVLLAEVCASIEALIRKVPAEIANPTDVLHGTLHVCVISSLAAEAIGSAFAAFRQRCPMVEIAVEVAPWDIVEMKLLRRQTDIGMAPTRFRRPELNYEILFREVHRLYCGRTHHAYGLTVSTVDALADEDFVLTGADEPDALREFRLHHGLGRRVAAQSNNLEEVRRLVHAGIGIAFLPEAFVTQDVERGDLWPVLARKEDLSMDIFAITNQNNVQSRLCEVFMTVLREQVEYEASDADILVSDATDEAADSASDAAKSIGEGLFSNQRLI